ncbi:MAG: U32 family peptidase [Clostridia bacterium]|nr:U32 family peptidase [Clostridia bacterium]
MADLGVAAMLRRQIPTLELHASTQASGHNAEAARRLAELGFSRMVCARELSQADLRTLVAESPIEIEMFIHGALCVSHSGQCLFSSLVGGRSGNRGACAQPCRLPYTVGGREAYPLSLKDLSLAAHVPSLIELGVASLKIEGRMKSPEYVRDVTAIWRRLLDERRGADAAEMRRLADIFSRGGFTDAYFRGLVPDGNNSAMLGVRSADDKAASRALESFRAITRTQPLRLTAVIEADAPMTLTAEAGGRTVTVAGDIPQPARTAPLDEDAVIRCLSKLGGTPYRAESIGVKLGEGLMVPVSRLNALRRAAIEALSPHEAHPDFDAGAYVPGEGVARPRDGGKAPMRVARFRRPEQITPDARDYFDRIYLPLDRFTGAADGVVLPPVILDGERALAEELLREAVLTGAEEALVGNLGHLDLVRGAGLVPHGDFRLNVVSGEALAALRGVGMADCLLSPELTLPQVRDFAGARSIIVYGRVPLMVLEKCAIREVADCMVCAHDGARLVDRRGVRFPMLREWRHRTLIVNSRPTYMLDKAAALRAAGVTEEHYLFTVETPAEVDAIIAAAKAGSAPTGEVRRI